MLPVQLTDLLGRGELLGQLVELMPSQRLVTLTGPGGCGKTRLALAVAERVVGPDAQFVDLTAAQPGALIPALRAALGIRDDPGRDLFDTVVAELGAGAPLLVLDGGEQLAAEGARFVEQLLARCPRLAVLVTSRRPLGVAGETVVAVPPLAVPAACQLFLERAQGRAGHPMPAASAGAVAALCAELDGLPLAIELAAARTAVLTVEELLARVRADLRLLRSTDPTAPERHRTLTAVVESSVGQLGEPERMLLRRLAVFPASFDPAAAAALYGDGSPPSDGGPATDGSPVTEGRPPTDGRTADDGSPPNDGSPAEPDGRLDGRGPEGADAPDGRAGLTASLDALVAASLVEFKPGDPPRYRLLSTVRRVCLLRLRDAGEEQSARRAHARHYLELAELADARLHGTEHKQWLAALADEWPNLCAAMSWLAGAEGAGEVRHGDLRLAAALATYCHLRGQYRDGQAWLAAALARNPTAPPRLRARAGTGAALLAMLLCDYPAAEEYARAARQDCRVTGDRAGQARVDSILGSVARERGAYPRSAAYLDAAAAGYAECGDELGEARATLLRGFTAWVAGNFARAEPRLHACLRWFEQLGDVEASASALVHLAAVAYYRGNSERAAQLLAAALRRYAGLGFPEGVSWAHNLLGLVELDRGHTGAAQVYLTESLAVHRRVGDRWRTASVLCALAEVARRAGAGRRSARLLGAAAAIREAIGVPVPACERSTVDATGAALRAELGAARFAAELRAGRTASLDALVAGDSPIAPG